ncbi:MAG: hypothetical protein HY904_23290 [Deltaproteobacteria bacterium]|nr:hypothetical protein [Deltaproteobacteria bacterium]
MGVNLPNILHGYLGIAPEGPAGARTNMDSARAAGFTHARFIASGYWPTDMTTGAGWVADKAAYFAAFDALVTDARARGLRLIPSLLWHLFLFPDLNNQPLSALFTPGSATRQMAEEYIRDVVTRYAGQDVILFWEIGNELNLAADLDFSTCSVCSGATNACGSLVPALGTPCQRTSADNFFSCHACRGVTSTAEDLGQFAGAITALIHGLDPGKPVSTGHAYPRASAWHLARSPCPACDWTADDAAQYESTLLQLHPSGVDIISVHHYPGDDARRFGSLDDFGAALVATTAEIARRAGRTLYVGEYGEPRAGTITCGSITDCAGDAREGATRRLTAAMLEARVDYSALWAWQFHQFCAAAPTCYTVEPSDDVAAWLITHEQAAGACTSSADGAACSAGWCQAGRCTPRVLLQDDFETGTGGWTSWTNCSGCTAGTLSAGTRAGGATAELVSHDLPCTGGCQYPGAYALSPFYPAAPGVVFLHVVAQASGETYVRVQFFDAADAQLGDGALNAPVAGTHHAAGMAFYAPVGTERMRVRLEVLAPNATLSLDEMRADWRP